MQQAVCAVGIAFVFVGSEAGTLGQLSGERLPFELRHGYLVVVTGSAGPLANLSFLLDTGAAQTVIGRRLADALSLAQTPARLMNFDRTVKVGRARMSSLGLGAIAIRNVDVLVGDLERFSEFADHVDAVIGMDVLQRWARVRIDYAGRVVTFDGFGTARSRDQPSPVFTVSLRVQGRPLRFVLDTGLRQALLYADRVQRHAPNLTLKDRIEPVRLGRLVGEEAMLEGIRLGDDDLRSKVFLIPKAPYGLPDDLDGYLGAAVLGARSLEFDFEADSLRWW
jgi:hypothetical protein